MPFLNFGGNKNKYCNLSDMNFFLKNIKILKIGTQIRIRIHCFQTWIRIHYYGKVDPSIRIRFFQIWIPGSGSMSK